MKSSVVDGADWVPLWLVHFFIDTISCLSHCYIDSSDHYIIYSLLHQVIRSLKTRLKSLNDPMFQSPNGSMTQFFNQPLRLLQVFGIKPFGEPDIDDGQSGA